MKKELELKEKRLKHKMKNQAKKWTRLYQINTCWSYRLLTPGLDNTCLFMSLTAGAGTRCMSLLSSSLTGLNINHST